MKRLKSEHSVFKCPRSLFNRRLILITAVKTMKIRPATEGIQNQQPIISYFY